MASPFVLLLRQISSYRPGFDLVKIMLLPEGVKEVIQIVNILK